MHLSKINCHVIFSNMNKGAAIKQEKCKIFQKLVSGGQLVLVLGSHQLVGCFY